MMRHCEECRKPITSLRATRFCSRQCALKVTNRHRLEKIRARGGRRKNLQYGYVVVQWPEHPMASKSGSVFEHRVVMAEHLGRMLSPTEVVHHKNGIRNDNRLENLELMDRSEHCKVPIQRWKEKPCPHCGGLLLAVGRVLPAEENSAAE